MAHVTVTVTLKPTLLDAQGRTVQAALRDLGFSDVEEVRIGKVIDLEIHNVVGGVEALQERAAQMCDTLLANPVTESYRIEVNL